MIALGVVAFVVVVLEFVAVVAGVIAARRFWRQVGPQLKPLLAMFVPAPPSVPERIHEYAPPAVDDDPRVFTSDDPHRPLDER